MAPPHSAAYDDYPRPRTFRSSAAQRGTFGAGADPALAPVAAPETTIANIATRIVRARGAPLVSLGNGRTRVLGAEPGKERDGPRGAGAQNAPGNAAYAAAPAKEKPPWRSYFNYEKPEDRAGRAPSGSTAGRSARGRSATRQTDLGPNGQRRRALSGPGSRSDVDLADSEGPNERVYSRANEDRAMTDAERFRRRVAEIQNMRSRSRDTGEDFRLDYGDYFLPGDRQAPGFAEARQEPGSGLRTANSSRPASVAQHRLFGGKPSPAASLGHSRQHATTVQPETQTSFVSADDNFATFRYDPGASNASIPVHTVSNTQPNTQQVHVPPAASPAVRPHTTQNSPYRPPAFPASPPYNPANQVRSATSVGYAPAPPVTVNVAPAPIEYVFRPPAGIPNSW